MNSQAIAQGSRGLDLSCQLGRRQGMSKTGYNQRPLHNQINGSATPIRVPRATMAKSTAKVEQEKRSKMILPDAYDEDENITRQPDSSDSEDDNRANIKHSYFGGPEDQDDAIREERKNLAKSSFKKSAKDEGSKAVRASSRKTQASPASSQSSTNGTKRKKDEDTVDTSTLGRHMGNSFEGATSKSKKRKPQKTYTRTPKVETPNSISFTVSDEDEESPSKSSKSESHSTPRKTKSKTMILPNMDTPKKPNSFAVPDGYSPAVGKKLVSPAKKKASFIMPDMDYEVPKPESISSSGVIVPTIAGNTTANSSHALDDILQSLSQDFVGDARTIMVGVDNSVGLDIDDVDDDYFLSMTQKGRCPICNQVVNPDDLREFGAKTMGIKQQAKFCRWHKTNTAKENWEDNEYPTIDWTELDSRIAKHHSFIKNLIKGEDSHYRSVLGDRIEAGEDRTAMTTKTNLTPGYYGTRGLRIISENLFAKFTPLLKKRMIQDRIMSSRGFAPYVQSVLVPEVAVRLIMEDMKVDGEEAREILTNSAEIGELMNDEIKDVVRKRKGEVVVDSDESDRSDQSDD